MRFLIVVSCLLLSFTVESQVLDNQYNPVLLQPNRFNDPIVQPDGKILLFGDGTQYIGGTSNNRLVVRLNANGSIDETFNAPITKAYAETKDCALLSDGKILVLANNEPYLRQLNSDGTQVVGFPSGTPSNAIAGPNGFVYRMIRLGGDRIMLTGNFNLYNGTPTPRSFVIVNSDGTPDTNFISVSINHTDIVTAIRQPDGKIIMALKKESSNQYEIKRFNTNGTLDNEFVSPVFNNSTSHLLILSDGKILVGGNFSVVDGIEKKTLIRLNTNGSLDNSFVSNNESYHVGLQSLALTSDNKIIVAGKAYQFISPFLYRLNEDGSRDDTFTSKAPNDVMSEIKSIIPLNNGKFLITGAFTEYQNEQKFSLAQLDNQGNLDQTFNGPSMGAIAYHNAVNMDMSGRMYIFGSSALRSVDGTIVNNVIRLTPDGSLDTSFPQGTGFSGNVNTFGFQADGKLIVAGSFNQYNGINKSKMIRFNTDDSIDPGFSVNIAGNSENVYSINVQTNGKIIIAGDFTSVNGISRNYLARLNADGTLDETFNAGNILTSYTSVKLLQDGSILLFTTTSVKKYSSNLVLISNFKTPDLSNTSQLNGITELQDGKLYLYGNFPLYSNQLSRRIVRLNANGSIDNFFTDPFNQFSTTGPTRSIDGIVVHDNQLLVFGDFNLEGRQGLVAVSLDGAKILSNFIIQKKGFLRHIFARTNKILLAGNFSEVNNEPRAGLALLNLSQPIPAAPTNLRITENRPTVVNLAWDDNATTESGYELQVSVGSQTNWKYEASILPNTTSYNYFAPYYYFGQNLHFRIAAGVPSGSSEFSNIASVVPLPILPTSLEVSAVSSTENNLVWNNGSNSTPILIQRKKNNQNFSIIVVSESVINNYQDTDTEINTPYVYRFGVIGSPTALATQNGYWDILSEFPGQSRQMPISFFINDKFYYGGGSFVNGLKDFWEYNLTTHTWTRKADFPGTAVVGQTVMTSKWSSLYGANYSLNDLVMVVGGLNASNAPVDEVWFYDTNNNVWLARTPFPGGPFYGASTFNVASNFGLYPVSIVCGGVDEVLNTSGTWAFNWENNRWIKKADFPGEARVYGASMGFPLKAYYGLGAIGGVHANDMWEYDYLADKWEQIQNFPGEARSFSASSSLHNKGFIMGGSNNVDSFNDVWEFNSNTETWISRTSMPVKLTGSAIATTDIEILILGGSTPQTTNFSNTLYRFDPTIETPEAPSNLIIEYNFPTIAKLSWDDTSFEDYFVIERSTDNITYDSITFVAHNTITYTDDSLEPGVTYFYKIRSVNRAGSNTSDPVNFLITSIEEKSRELNVFPNPTTNKVHIQHNTYLHNIKLVDMKGHTVFEQSVESSSTQVIDLSYLPEGLYIIQMDTDLGKKLVKISRRN